MPRANNRGIFPYQLMDGSTRYGVRIFRYTKEFKWQGFPRLGDARQWYDDRKRDIREGRPFPSREQPKSLPTLHAIIQRYLSQATNKKNYVGEQDYAKAWVAQLGTHVMNAVTATMIDQARTHFLTVGPYGKPLSHSTVNRYVSWLHHVLRLEVDRGTMPHNPCALFIKSPRRGGQKFQEPKPPEVEFTPAEEAALARELGRYADVPTLAILTGLRQEELFGLTKADLELDHGYGKLHDPKGGEPQVFLISQQAKILFQQFSEQAGASRWIFPHPKDPDRPVNAKSWYGNVFKPAATRAGIAISRSNGKTFHTLRHTFASRLQQAGVEVKDIKDLGRWKSWKAMERYLKRDNARLRDAIERIGTVRKPYVKSG